MSFRDKEGREWTVEIDVTTIKRVREALDINLLELVVAGSDLPEKLGDPCLLVDVLYLLCKDRADILDLDDVAFGKAMTPDGIEDAWSSILEGIVNFSPRGLRPAYQKMLATATRYQEAQATRAKSLIESPEFEQMLTKELDRRLSIQETSPSSGIGGVGNSAESSESTPVDTPLQP